MLGCFMGRILLGTNFDQGCKVGFGGYIGSFFIFWLINEVHLDELTPEANGMPSLYKTSFLAVCINL